MSENTTIVVVSAPFQPGHKEANLALVESLLALEGDPPPDLVVFSEANVMGGFWKDGEKDYPNLAEAVPDGPSCRQVAELAAKYHTTICCGIVEQDAGRLYITHFLCGPEGFLGKQRKLYPSRPGKAGPLSPGLQLQTFPVRGHAAVVLACADILLPEGSILPQLAGASLVICPVDAFTAQQEGVVRRLIAARAMDAEAPIVAAFGHQEMPSGEPLLAGLAVSARGDIMELTKRPAGQPASLRVQIPPPQTPRVWGGFHARKQTLANFLDL